MIDTHCHIYSTEFDEDLGLVLQNAVSTGVSKIYMPAIDSSMHAAMLRVAEAFPFCKPMIGLHPCSVKADFMTEIKQIEMLLDAHRFIAIGETGLDFYWDKTFMKQQYEALHIQAELAIRYALPLVLHTREAMKETIAEMEPYANRGLKAVFHCFGGTVAEAQAITGMGYYLGIGGVLTFKNAKLDGMIQSVEMNQLLLETDAPYLAPVPFRGKRNEPKFLLSVAEKLAEIKQIPVSEVQRITTENALRLFEPGHTLTNSD